MPREKCRESYKFAIVLKEIHSTPALRTPRYYGHPAITDTSLLRTKEKSPAENIKKYMKIALAITDARYYGHTDTSPGPKVKFSLFFSRYNGHFRHVFKNWSHLNSWSIWQNNSKLGLC